MLSAIALIALAGSMGDQEFEGLLLDVPLNTTFKTTTSSNYRAYVAEITGVLTTGAVGITQVIAVVVTDLDKLPSAVTPEQFWRAHDRQSRTRAGFAGQLIKTAETTLGGTPMAVLIGSMAAALPGKSPVGMFHLSAATTYGKKAYEVTWLTYKFGVDFTDAVTAVRNIRMKTPEGEVGPLKHIGTEGNYTMLGVPYSWKLPTAATVVPSPVIKENYAGRYQGSVRLNDAVAQVEVIQFKEAPAGMTPAAMAREIASDWLPATENPPPIQEAGITRFDNLSLPNNRKGRIEVAVKDKLLVSVRLECPATSNLPSREVISLQALP